MKKKVLLISLIFFLLLIPLKIKAANVEIKEVEILEKSDGLTEFSKPTFKDLKVNFDLGFNELRDYIQYKLVLKNNDEKDYEVDEQTKFSEDNHIKYDISYEGKENVIKAGGEKVVYITVTYENEVPVEKFVDGVYKEDNNVVIILSTKEVNPNTLAFGLLGVAVPLLVLSVVLLIVNKNKMTSLMSFAIGTMLLIPLISIAIDKIEIEISAKITIEPPVKTFSIITDNCGQLDDGGNVPTYEAEYKIGMTWVDFFNSDYYDGELGQAYYKEIMQYDYMLFYKKGFGECLNKIEAPDEDGDYTDEELDELWDEYNTQEDACYDNYVFDAHKNDLIKPEEEGQYYLDYCPIV